jgi:hypothetical protein
MAALEFDKGGATAPQSGVRRLSRLGRLGHAIRPPSRSEPPLSSDESRVHSRAVTMEAEHKTYSQLLQSELADQGGRYVVIIRDRLLGIFSGYNEALVAGYAECGLSPFLLKRVPLISQGLG